jgi:hypothetical protein
MIIPSILLILHIGPGSANPSIYLFKNKKILKRNYMGAFAPINKIKNLYVEMNQHTLRGMKETTVEKFRLKSETSVHGVEEVSNLFFCHR